MSPGLESRVDWIGSPMLPLVFGARFKRMHHALGGKLWNHLRLETIGEGRCLHECGAVPIESNSQATSDQPYFAPNKNFIRPHGLAGNAYVLSNSKEESL